MDVGRLHGVLRDDSIDFLFSEILEFVSIPFQDLIT